MVFSKIRSLLGRILFSCLVEIMCTTSANAALNALHTLSTIGWCTEVTFLWCSSMRSRVQKKLTLIFPGCTSDLVASCANIQYSVTYDSYISSSNGLVNQSTIPVLLLREYLRLSLTPLLLSKNDAQLVTSSACPGPDDLCQQRDRQLKRRTPAACWLSFVFHNAYRCNFILDDTLLHTSYNLTIYHAV